MTASEFKAQLLLRGFKFNRWESAKAKADTFMGQGAYDTKIRVIAYNYRTVVLLKTGPSGLWGRKRTYKTRFMALRRIDQLMGVADGH